MQSIKEIINSPATPFSGSSLTFNMVAEQIEQRFGSKERKVFDPKHNCRTFAGWLQLGWRVKKGEKALRSVTFVEVKDADGNIVKRFPRKISLFYYRQVEKIDSV